MILVLYGLFGQCLWQYLFLGWSYWRLSALIYTNNITLNINHNDLVGSLKSLESDFYIETTTSETKSWNLTEEALYNV